MASTFHVQSFGCRATQADGAAIERALLRRGLQRAAQQKQAGIVILNTCTVTAAADADARSAIRRIHRQNPECRILVTGCYAQRAPQELAVLEGVEWVVGNSHKHAIADVLMPAASGFVSLEHLQASAPHMASQYVSDIFAHTELLAAPVFEAGSAAERTRPNLKVQDGCDNRCSFCVIPSVRGHSRSLPLDAVIREVDSLVAAGYREMVLSGINLGRWGRDFIPAQRFEALLHAILLHTAIDKIRISSVEPMDWSAELIALVTQHPRIARHAHVPLQSGSDGILRAMHRKYRPWHYAERIEKIRAAAPEAAIGADVMVGFPGETEERFEQSRSFIASLPFTYLHVFTYSARPGTPAAALPQQVPVQLARARNQVLRTLAAEKNLRFRLSFLGKSLPAITLARQEGDATEALSDNYLKITLAARHAANQWVQARVEDITPDGLRACVATE
ncbi:MAG: tRNA (N(6)-L-threonylcarbamoyladenosine(37)-C(2))-methylthiotransferase MtaB [Candidatus Acidiferrum sp.]